MRASWAAAALMLLSGCQDAPAPAPGDTPAAPGTGASGAGPSGDAYHYAFTLPPTRLKAAAQVHADACARLGPARCRVVALRYKLAEDDRVLSSLAVRIDPALARSFADAIVKSVNDSNGMLTAFEIAAPEARAGGESRIVRQLRDAQRAARAEGRAGAARADQLQTALDAIADVEAAQPGIPLRFDYRSTTPLSRFAASGAVLRNAGQTFVDSSGRLLEILANFGPWLLALLAVLLGLGWLGRRHTRTLIREETPVPAPDRANAPRKSMSPRDNVMRPWFAPEREDGEIVHI